MTLPVASYLHPTGINLKSDLRQGLGSDHLTLIRLDVLKKKKRKKMTLYFWIQFAFPIQITFIWSPSWLLALQCGLYSRFIKFHFHSLFFSSFFCCRKWICESVLIVFCSGKKSIMLSPRPPASSSEEEAVGGGGAWISCYCYCCHQDAELVVDFTCRRRHSLADL